MKILFIHHSTIMSGSTISFLNTINGLRQEGVHISVVIPSNREMDPKLAENLKSCNIKYYRAPVVRSIIKRISCGNFLSWMKNTLLLPYRKNKSKKALEKIILEVKPDIIHTNVGVVHEGYHLARKYNIPHVWHLREYQTKDFHWYIYPSYNVFCSYLMKSNVITITDGIRDYFKLRNAPKAQTIYNGIFHENEIQFNNCKENFFFLSSRISPEKGHLDVIKAFGRFSKKNEYRIKIAGEGSEAYVQQIVNTAKVYGCADRIDFLGFVQDVKDLMSKAKALIVASYYEGFGRMTAEATFCGTIVIGRNTAGTKEIMSVTGGLPFITVQEMTQRMEDVAKMNIDDYYNDYIKKAHKEAISNYSIENNVHQIYNLYKSILK